VPPISETAEILRIAGAILFIIGLVIATDRRELGEHTDYVTPGFTLAAIGAVLAIVGQTLRPSS
jgi:hypothetical protein